MKSQVGLVQEAFWPYEGGYLPEERCDYKYCTKPCHKNLTDAATYQHIIGPIGRVRGALWATPLCDPGSNCHLQNCLQHVSFFSFLKTLFNHRADKVRPDP